jgi:glycosyltransferase involved in cell wall biosynthesis
MQEQKSIRWNKNVFVHYNASGNLSELLKDKQSDGALIHMFKVGTRILLSKFVKNPLEKWQKSTLAKLKEIHLNQPFDCIVSSFSPQEAHLVAVEFKKEFPTVPWIADMRDEMSANPYIDSKTKRTLLEVEKQVNQYANALISVSEPILSDFKNSLPKIKFFEEIRNGFNHDFKRDKVATEKNATFTLGYFGTFYGKRKPTVLMEALKQLSEEIPDFDFKFEIIGAHKNFIIPTDLESKIYLSHESYSIFN